MSKIRTEKGLFGQDIHYKDGVRIGESWDGLVPGSKNHYDANGRFIGYSDRGFFADQVHHDASGTRVGETWSDSFGVSRHYDDRGRKGTSYSDPLGTTSFFDRSDDSDSLFGSSSSDDSSPFDW